MTFPNEINKVLLGDGTMFLAQGFLIFAAPSPQRLLTDKVDSKIALPAFKDVRRALGAGFISMGIVMIAIAGNTTKGSDLNTMAIFRAISLVPIVYAGIRHIKGKRWKSNGSQIMFTVLQGILILIYLYFGVLEPM